MKENKVLDIIKNSVILLLITAIAAAMLAFVNSKTAPLIALNSQKKQETALMAVADNASEMQEVEITDEMRSIAEGYNAQLDCVYKSVNSIGELTGYCAVITTNGYDTGLQTAVGTNLNAKVCGVEIIASNETPGLGQNASKPEFTGQYKDKGFEIGVAKDGAGDNEINALSGATMTSNAVTGNVNAVLEISQYLLGENNGEVTE